MEGNHAVSRATEATECSPCIKGFLCLVLHYEFQLGGLLLKHPLEFLAFAFLHLQMLIYVSNESCCPVLYLSKLIATEQTQSVVSNMSEEFQS